MKTAQSTTAMRNGIEKFLSRFPKNATSWAQATDEVRDLSRMSREYLEDLDEMIVEAVNFKGGMTPARWNTEGRDSIMANFDRMSAYAKAAFYERFMEFFG